MVDPLVARDHAHGEVLVAADQSIHRLRDGEFRKAAHFRHQTTQAGDVLVERLDGVLGHHRSSASIRNGR